VLQVGYHPAKGRKGLGAWGEFMEMLKRALPAAVALAVVSAITLVLWYAKLTMFGPEHPVFFYLLPIALVTILYGRWPALLGVFAAAACADYFLYDPIYSFVIDTRVEAGDLACFMLVALLGIKCASELFHPTVRVPAPRSRYD
jgi:K+-sensing histidine kinase KdpD